MRLLSEDSGDNSSERSEQQFALAKAIDCMALSMETNPVSFQSKKEKRREYEHECRQKCSTSDGQENAAAVAIASETSPDTSDYNIQSSSLGPRYKLDGESVEEGGMLSYQRKVTVLYELLSACLADIRDDDKKVARRRKGYDARHRVALRLLATWLDIKWLKMVCMLTLIFLL